jgi:hypothetical protein
LNVAQKKDICRQEAADQKFTGLRIATASDRVKPNAFFPAEGYGIRKP